jgi:hypothetical protein
VRTTAFHCLTMPCTQVVAVQVQAQDEEDDPKPSKAVPRLSWGTP